MNINSEKNCIIFTTMLSFNSGNQNTCPGPTYFFYEHENINLFQVSNYSRSTVEVKCQSGYSGGLSQRFIMEVFETVNNSQVLVATNWTDLNVGNNQEVNLGVGGLLPDSDYIISVKASNERGESSPIYVGGSTR